MALWPDPDATLTSKGLLQLTGDLGGTAASPTVPGLTGKFPKLTPTSTKSSSYTATAGDMVICDGTSAGFTITMPAASAGAVIAVRKGDATTNRIVIAVTGGDVFGIVSTSTTVNLDVPGHTYTFVGVSSAWVPLSGNLPLTQLDSRYFVTNPLTSGEETMSRDICASNAVASATQSLRLTYFTSRRSQTTTQVRVCTGSTAAAATPTLCRIGLYSIDTAGAGTLVASVATDTTLFAAASTAYTRSWSSSYTSVVGQRYALGLLVVTSVAAPTFAGAVIAGGLITETGIDPRTTASLGSQTDLPSSFTNASLTTSLNRYYGAILP